MSASTRSKSTMSGPSQNTEHPLSDFEALLTRGMMKHMAPDRKDKYALLLKEDGNALYKERKFSEAIGFYSAAIGFKEDAVFYSNRSACYAGLKDYKKVIEDTSAALKLKPDFQKCLVRRAAAYEKLGKSEECMLDWLTAALCETGDIQKSSSFKMFKTTMETALLKAVDKMEMERLLQLPSADHIFSVLGGFDKETTVEGLPEDPSKLKADSGDFYLISGLNNMYTKQSSRYIEADVLFNYALSAYKNELKTDPTNEVLKRKLGVAYEYVSVFKVLKNDTSPTSGCKKSIELNPKRTRPLVFQSFVFGELGEFKEAEKCLKAAYSLAPKSGEVHYHYGLFYQRLYHRSQERADIEKAYECYKKAKLYRPDNVYTLIRLMEVALIVDDVDGLKRLEALGREKFSRSPEYANYSGELLRDANDWTGAMGQFQLSIVLGDITPGASIRVLQITNAVGMLINSEESKLFDLDVDAAKEMLEKAVKIDPRSDVVKLSLGHLRMREGKDDEGIALYKEAAVLCPNYEGRILAAGLAFSQSIDSNMRKNPELYKKFRGMNLDQFLPCGATNSQVFLDMLTLNCPCCNPHSLDEQQHQPQQSQQPRP